MLTRPPARDRSFVDTKKNGVNEVKREQRRLAQQRYRRRYDAGKFTVVIEIDAGIVQMLVSTGWLIEGETDRKKIAKTLAAMLSEAAKR
jgi:hypothetical protein